MLQANCPDCSLSVVSDFPSCDDCFICQHNEGIEGCRSIFWPIVFGTTLSIVIILVVMILYKFVSKDRVDGIIHSAIDYVFNFKQNRKEQKKQKRVKRVKEILEMDSVGFFQHQHGPPLPAGPPRLEANIHQENPTAPLYPDLYQELQDEVPKRQ